MKRRTFLAGLTATPVFLLGCTSCSRDAAPTSTARASGERASGGAPPTRLDPPPPVGDRLVLSESEWRERLSDEEFYVLREKGTERAFTHPTHDVHRSGLYACAGCGAPLFTSETKFDSGTGWPSFHTPIEEGRIEEEQDSAFGMVRTEVLCARCGGHLGHVFPDGPAPTGLRYCINGVAMDFFPEE